MPDPEIVLPELVIPLPRRRRQRRLDPNAPVDGIGIDLPGPANDSGHSEQDVPRTSELRAQLQGAAQRAVPENAFGNVHASALPPAAEVLGGARAGGIQIDEEEAHEAQQQARVDASMAPLSPSQRAQVQALPISGAHEDDDESTDAMIGAAHRAVGTPQAPSTKLRMPMTSVDPGPAAPQLRAPMSGAPVPPTGLRAPGVAPGLEEEEIDSIGADPEPRPMPQPNAKTMAAGAPRAPAEDARDAADRLQSVRMQRAQRALAILSAVPALFGGRSGGASGAGLARLSQSFDPNTPLERLRARHAARDEAEQAAEQQAYERSMAERRAGIEERRVAQAEGATRQDVDRQAAMYDPQHAAAQSARLAYARLYRAVPPAARPQLSAFAPDQSMRGMSAMDVRQQAALLSQAWGRLQQENPNLFRVGRRSSGGGLRRGQLAGLNGGQRRTTDYGVSEGLTQEDYDALGVDPRALGIELDTPEGADDMPDETPPPTRVTPRESRGERSVSPGPQAPRASGGGVAPQPRAGRVDISQREPTPEEYRALSPDERSTVALLRAYRRAHPGSTWDDASAAAPLLQPAERSSLLAQHGSDSVVQVPGWRQTANIQLQPQEIRELRARNAATDRMISAASRMDELAASMSTANLARNVWSADDQAQLALNISREMQATMRALQNMGVPNGPEMAMALEQAGEIRTPRDLARVRTVYAQLSRWAREQNRDLMQSYGFARRRGGGF